MKKSILDLPDDVLLDLFSRYVSLKDLGRLDQVCQRFHAILYNYHEPWRTALNRLTNVSFSFLKNQAGCPALQVRSLIKDNSLNQFAFFLEYSPSCDKYTSTVVSSN